MKLSQAIRLGSMMSPQSIGLSRDPDTGGTCAIAAALDAVSCSDADPMQAYALWPVLSQISPTVEGHGYLYLYHDVLNAVIYLNDTARWSRERIADWVEQIEKSEKPPTTTEEQAELVMVNA